MKLTFAQSSSRAGIFFVDFFRDAANSSDVAVSEQSLFSRRGFFLWPRFNPQAHQQLGEVLHAGPPHPFDGRRFLEG